MLGTSQNCGIWLKPINITDSPHGSVIAGVLNGENRILLQINYNHSRWYMSLQIVKDGTLNLLIADDELNENEWNYVSFSYNSDTNNIYLVSNNNIYSDIPNGIWGDGDWIIMLSATNETNFKVYVDEAIFITDEFIPPEVFVDHYLHNAPWGADYVPQ
jgi:hypothetical protein